MARKTAAAAAPATSGPRAETLAFAAKVVKLRDVDGLPWATVALKLKVPYDQNGSSRLRRAYILGSGKTVGTRSKATPKKATKKATPRKRAAAAPAGTRSARKRGSEAGLNV